MKPILLEDIIKAVNGVIIQNINTDGIYINSISTDTRTILENSLFIPIVGENFDGHNFIKKAFALGARCCLIEKNQKDLEKDLDFNNNFNNNLILIKVSSTRDALKDLARYYIGLFKNKLENKLKVVALTGSAGKTTTKDMIASCISQKYNVLKTQGNFNNEIGLPLTVFNIEECTEVAILEMGMNHAGEISELSKIVRPDIALITNIGYAHIENFDNIDGIFSAKYEIFDYLSKNGIKILNADDEILYSLSNIDNIKFYSLNNNINNNFNNINAFASDIVEDGINGINANINYLNNLNNNLTSFNLDLKYSGKHILSNTLPAVIISDILGLNASEIKKGLEEFTPSKMRMDIVKPANNSYTIINDVYNANPTSMRATLDVLSNCNTRKVAILGDMYELGKYTNRFHEEIGKYGVEKNIDELIFIGEHAKYMLSGAKSILDLNNNFNNNNNIKISHFDTQEDFYKNISSCIKKGDTILVKASRGMKLEKTVNILLEN